MDWNRPICIEWNKMDWIGPNEPNRLHTTKWNELDRMDRTRLNSNYIFWTWNLWFTKWSKDNDSVYWTRIGAIHPSLLTFFFFFFTLHLFNFHFLLLLTFLNQWLRLKVAKCNFQSQPFIGIALGAISKVLHLISIIYLLVTCQSFFKMRRIEFYF